MPTSKTEQARLATLTPVEYVQELNVESRAWVAANPGAWASGLSEDPTLWASYGYTNGLETAFGLACSEYSDYYKSVYNIRPRGERFASLEAVEAAIAELDAAAEREAAWEAKREEREADRAAFARMEERAAAHAAHVVALLATETRYMDAAAACGAAGW